MSSSTVWDVIVIGAGSAGLPCAIRAAERGAKVLQLEADYRVGGTLFWSSGQISAAGTRLQKSQGIEDSPDEHFRDAQRIAHGRIDPLVLRLFVDNAAATIDWLCDLGFQPAPGTPVAGEAHEPYATRRYLWGANKAVSILETLKPVHDRLVLKGRIDLRLQHRFLRFVVDGRGRVNGVRAATPNGEFEFAGKNVVLATGGYAANPALWRELTPKIPLCSLVNPYARGDGLLAVRDLGVAPDGAEKFLCTFAGYRDDPEDGRTGQFLTLAPKARSVWELFVNSDGRRFMREDHPSIDYRERSLLRQRGLAMHVILDHGILMNATPMTLDTPEGYRAKFGRHPAFVKAKTLGELAKKLGVPGANLRRTVAEFNAAVEARVDRRFDRYLLLRRIEQAPFYGIRGQGFTVVSPAGLRVDRRLRVVGPNGRGIPNLYAVGEVLGFGRTSGDAFVGGLSLTPALTFGKMLGESLLEW